VLTFISLQIKTQNTTIKTTNRNKTTEETTPTNKKQKDKKMKR
jgi:hypothetical protein